MRGGRAKFLLEKIRERGVLRRDDTKEFISKSVDAESMYPYLLVNIGSGVSIIKVDKDGHERVSGSNIGGGTFWGLCRLLTGLKDYDEMLKLSAQADNAKVDMLVGRHLRWKRLSKHRFIERNDRIVVRSRRHGRGESGGLLQGGHHAVAVGA